MSCQHGGNSRASRKTVSIATMHNSGVGHLLAEAVFAHSAVAVECRSGTNKPEIVEGLDNGHLFGICGVVDRGRDQRKSVVNVNKLNTLLIDKHANCSVRIRIPDATQSHFESGQLFDSIVVERVLFDQMAAAGK